MDKCNFFTHKCINFTLNTYYKYKSNNTRTCVRIQAFDQKKIRRNWSSGSKVMDKCNFFTHKCVNFTLNIYITQIRKQ